MPDRGRRLLRVEGRDYAEGEKAAVPHSPARRQTICLRRSLGGAGKNANSGRVTARFVTNQRQWDDATTHDRMPGYSRRE